MERYDLIIIGAGPGGLAAAAKAKECGVQSILILERNPEAGGILNQCIHDGFGVERFGEALSGPEYVARFLPALNQEGITLKCGAMALELTREPGVRYIDRHGMHNATCGALILATGCRERTRGAIAVPGDRPAGIYTAGVVQHLVNIDNVLPGKRAVILGSGDIGLIMARRLTLEGMEIACVLEKLPYCSGLARNVRQCLQDYDIPLHLSTTVTHIIGKKHLEAVVVTEFDSNGKPIPSTSRTIPCDTLVLSVGLIPENELAKACGIKMDPVTGGALVDGQLMTSVPGIFSCGNGLHVHDIVDMVSAEAETAAENAARYILNKQSAIQQSIALDISQGIRYALPRSILPNSKTTLSMRVSAPGRMQTILVERDGQVIAKKAMRRLSPAEMIRIPLPPLPLEGGSITISVRQDDIPADMLSNSELTCTVCPNGCSLIPIIHDDGSVEIQGALCPRGIQFGTNEVTNPMRTLTSTLRIQNGAYPLVAVRGSSLIPKKELRQRVRELREVTLSAPVNSGQRINAGGMELIITGSVKEK